MVISGKRARPLYCCPLRLSRDPNRSVGIAGHLWSRSIRALGALVS
jgi:hypothetical protein